MWRIYLLTNKVSIIACKICSKLLWYSSSISIFFWSSYEVKFSLLEEESKCGIFQMAYLIKKSKQCIFMSFYITPFHPPWLLFIYFIYSFLAVLGLHCCAWVFPSCCGERGYSSLRCTGFSLWWLLLLWSMGSGHAVFRVIARGLSSCGSWALERRLSSCGARA